METSTGRRMTNTGESKEGKTLRHSILAADSMIFNEERDNLVKTPGLGNSNLILSKISYITFKGATAI